MHLSAIAPVAALAFAVGTTASLGSFYMAPPSALGLSRRDEIAYQPNATVCSNPGNTCAQVCGADYDQCAAPNPDETHCYKPSAEVCCEGGNSCEKGFSCAKDTSEAAKNYCCPDGMSLDDCAAKFGVKGSLQSAVRAVSTSVTPSSTETPYSAPPATAPAAPLMTALVNSTTSTTQSSVLPATSAVRILVNNVTAIAGPTQPVPAPYLPSQAPLSNITVSGSSSSGVSSLLLVLAGFAAVM